MSIGGNLRTMPFPDLLQWVSQSRKTGTLVIDGNDFKKKLYFTEGQIVATASNDPREFLGYYLVGWKFIDEEELPELLEMQDRYGSLLGELLVMIGRVSEDDLRWILTSKTEDSLFDIFLWEEADFQFLDNILPTMKFKPLELSVDALIMEGVRRKDEWERMISSIPGIDWIPRLKRAIDIQQLGPTEVGIVRHVDGSNSIEEIALSCRLSPFFVSQFIFQGLPQDIFTLLPPATTLKAIPGMVGAGWRIRLREAERSIESGKFIEAITTIETIRKDFPDNREALEFSNALNRQFKTVMKELQMESGAIPELAIPLSEITSLDCSPEEGFLLSRINGLYSIDAILQMLPGRQETNRLLLAQMLHQKIIRIKET